ncbi:hypothetical protein N7478_002003 [Penicillium angulare]|uniref:uncharacterized protein n=1 Tax=Penicillium angulare TaxID=116970 RepID=UPI0025413FDC|nr:uncharacterized protein N7478_002003 [Penicillium angulare]KAJ5288973.1 hypothetical protein N7478_002003 [Penicillium angulare]
MKATFAISAMMAALATALPTPSNVLSSTLSSTSGVASEVHSVLTVTHGVTNQKMLVELTQKAAGLLTGSGLGSVASPVGTIVDTASNAKDLVSPSGATGLITVALSGTEFGLVELDGTVEGLLSSLGLGEVSTVVGTVVGTVEGAATSAKRDATSNLLSLTGLNGQNVLVKAEGLLSNVDLSSVTGSVLAEVPGVSSLASKAKELGENPTQLIGVATSTGSALLVKVEGLGGELTEVLGGLLSTLGLGDLTKTVGTVVSTVEGAASSAKRDATSNLLSLTGLNGQSVLVKAEGLLSNVDLSSVTGSVLAEVPGVSSLASKAKELGENPTQLIGVATSTGSALLVKVEGLGGEVTSLVSGLLSTLGLGDLTKTVGTVVTSA